MISGDNPDTPVDTMSQRGRAQLLGLHVVAHDDHRGAAVVERTGVAGRDGAVGPEDGLQLGDGFVGGAGAWAVVGGDDGAVGQRHRAISRSKKPPLMASLGGSWLRTPQ